MNMARTSKRTQIVQTASHIVLAEGVSSLTLDAVAEKAGISKGGLLYHFPTKDALITGMIDTYIADFERRLDELLQAQPPGRGRWLRAYVQATFRESLMEPSVVTAGLAALANNPLLLESLNAAYDRWKALALADGVDADLVMVVLLATEGAWYSRLLGLTLVDEAVQQQMEVTLLRLIDGA